MSEFGGLPEHEKTQHGLQSGRVSSLLIVATMWKKKKKKKKALFFAEYNYALCFVLSKKKSVDI